MKDRRSILTTPKALIASLLFLSMVVVSHAQAQNADPRLAIRGSRDIGVSSVVDATLAIGAGQSVNNWDDRFGYGKSAALNGWGSAMASDTRGNIYLGGSFTQAGGFTSANYIGYWNGDNWSKLGEGLNGPVTSISVMGSEVYVGGQFTMAGALPISQNLVKWDGAKWVSVGNGLPGLVTDVEYFDGSLYVSGWFSNAGNSGASYIARFDGSSWQPLASGVNGWVSSMAVYNDKLVAVGLFTGAGGKPGTSYIAAWDGNEWASLGGGSNDLMLTVTSDGKFLYAGGAFTSVSNVEGTSYIARWDGRNWESLGGGLSDWASSIHVVDGVVAVGGWFKNAINANGKQVSVNRLATFNTENGSWSSVGNGISYSVDKETVALSVAQVNGNVYVAGVFNIAGNTPSLGFARWIDMMAQAYEMPKLVSPSNHTVLYGSSAKLKWDAVDGSMGYTVQISTDSTFNAGVITESTVKTDYTLNNVTPSVDYYWRVRSEFANMSSHWSPRHQFMRGVATSLEEGALQPGEFRLLQNYPNPFNPGTTIGFELSESTQVTITIHSVDGRIVATLVNELKTAGSHQASFDAQNLSSGVYLYRMQTQKNVITRTMTLVK
jgi:hypothetical protein